MTNPTFVYTNGARTQLAQDLNAADISFTVKTGSGSLFPSPQTDQIISLALISVKTGATEYVYATSRDGDLFIVQRAQENSAALRFVKGDRVEIRVTAAALNHANLTPGVIIAVGANIDGGPSTALYLASQSIDGGPAAGSATQRITGGKAASPYTP